MAKDKFSAIVTINGRRYDAESGRPIASFFSDGAADSTKSTRFSKLKFSRAKESAKKSRAAKPKFSEKELRILMENSSSAKNPGFSENAREKDSVFAAKTSTTAAKTSTKIEISPAKNSRAKNPGISEKEARVLAENSNSASAKKSATKKSSEKNAISRPKKSRAKRASKQARIAAEIAAEFGAAANENAKSSDETNDFSRASARAKSPNKNETSPKPASVKTFAEKNAKNDTEKRKKTAQNNENLLEKSANGPRSQKIARENAENQNVAAPWLQEFFDRRSDFSAQNSEKPAKNDLILSKDAEKSANENFSQRAARELAKSDFAAKSTELRAKNLPEAARANAKNLRRHSQHSMTLNRRFVKRPQLQKTLARHAIATQPTSKSRARPLFSTTHMVTATPDEFVPHPLREAAVARQHAMQAEIRREAEREAREVARENLAKMQFATSGSSLKNALIAESLAAAEPAKFVSVREKPAKKMTKKSRKNRKICAKKSARNRRLRPATIASLGFAVALAAGYVAYVSAPNISVRIAAIDAGIDARAPVAVAGFSASGAAISAPGRVTISYKKGDQTYSVAQSKATQNAADVNRKLANGGNREIYSRDATIYRAGDESSWARGGMIYTVRGGNLDDLDVASIANSLE